MPFSVTGIFTFVATGVDIGGAAIVFHTMKNVIFGKTLKTVEYPSGMMRTINLHFPTVNAMRRRIASANQLEDADMVKQMYKWEDNFWTEPVKSSSDVRILPDYAWIIWTRNAASKVPGRGVKLKEMGDATTAVSTKPATEPAAAANTTTTNNKQDATTTNTSTTTTTTTSTAAQPQQAAATVATPEVSQEVFNTLKVNCVKTLMQLKQSKELSEQESNILLELALNDDTYVLALYSNFKGDKTAFIRYAKKKAASLLKDSQTVAASSSEKIVKQ